jgi:putative transposase
VTPTYHRARHSLSVLHAHLVFVTNYRRPAFTNTMLTFTKNTMAACAQVSVAMNAATPGSVVARAFVTATHGLALDEFFDQPLSSEPLAR